MSKTLLSLVAVVVLAGCYGNPTPHIDQAPADCAPVKIVFAGDSLMVQSADAITEQLHADGYPVETRNIAHGGSNVIEYGMFPVDTGYPNPRAELEATIVDFAPDIVVADWGINVPWWLGGIGWDYAAWATQATMTETRDMVTAHGAALFWATIPPRGDADAGWAYYTNLWVHDLGVGLVDWRAAVTPAEDSGVYAQYLKYPEDDQVRPVRADDGIHFTADGVGRVAQWTAAALEEKACK